MGGAFSQIIMFALLALVVMVVIGFVMRKFRGGGNGGTSGNSSGVGAQSPFAFQGAGNANDAGALMAAVKKLTQKP